MNREEFHEVIKDDLRKLGSYDTNGYVDQRMIVSGMSERVRVASGVANLSLELSKTSNGEYVVYRFKDDSGLRSYSSAFAFNVDTFESVLADTLESVKNSIDALEIINALVASTFEDIGDANQKPIYAWGNHKYCEIGAWDYEEVEVILSSTAIKNIVEMYNNGGNAFRSLITEYIVNSNFGQYNVISMLNNFNEIPLNKYLGAEIKPVDKAELLSNGVITHADAVKYLSNNKHESGLLRIQLLDIVGQGTVFSFAAFSCWDIDYDNKNISTSLLGDKVMDMSTGEMSTNYAICSKVESTVGPTNSEKESIF
jgi:hypothetical protein